MKNLSTAKCLNCHHTFGPSSIMSGNYFVCSHCGARYPVLNGQIPVFFQRPAEMLGAFYWSYERFFKEQAEVQRKLRQLINRESRRSNLLRSIDHAVAFNNDYLRSIQLKLREFISIDDLLKGIELNYPAGYSKVLHYLRRDWSGLPETEEEIGVVWDCVKEQILQHATDRSSAYVTGAGMGRIVFELGRLFEHVSAIDDSPTMVSSFYKLFESDIDFYHINAKKVFRDEDSAIRLKASLPRDHAAGIVYPESLTYFLGDALQAPLPDASQAVVISVYFTDVFPLPEYLKEVKRVLKPGGLLIHFGPLEYHFSEIEHMLTANEVRQVLEDQGFAILHEKEVENSHLHAAETMTRNVYRNWMFTARKLEADKTKSSLLPGSRIIIAEGVTFDIQGSLLPEGEKINSITVTKRGNRETLQVSKAIFELLKLADGRQSIEDLIDIFSERYEMSPSLREQLSDTILDLYQRGILIEGTS